MLKIKLTWLFLSNSQMRIFLLLVSAYAMNSQPSRTPPTSPAQQFLSVSDVQNMLSQNIPPEHPQREAYEEIDRRLMNIQQRREDEQPFVKLYFVALIFEDKEPKDETDCFCNIIGRPENLVFDECNILKICKAGDEITVKEHQKHSVLAKINGKLSIYESKATKRFRIKKKFSFLANNINLSVFIGRKNLTVYHRNRYNNPGSNNGCNIHYQGNKISEKDGLYGPFLVIRNSGVATVTYFKKSKKGKESKTLLVCHDKISFYSSRSNYEETNSDNVRFKLEFLEYI